MYPQTDVAELWVHPDDLVKYFAVMEEHVSTGVFLFSQLSGVHHPTPLATQVDDVGWCGYVGRQ